MGSSASRSSDDKSASSPEGFGVRMTPALLQSTGTHPSQGHTAQETVDDRSEIVRQAFQQGAEYAAGQMMQQQASLEAQQRQDELEYKKRDNEQRERLLRERIEELHAREYRAPVQPMGCKEERDAALDCYRNARGVPPGEVVFACQRAVRDLDKCASLMREASLAKIASSTLFS